MKRRLAVAGLGVTVCAIGLIPVASARTVYERTVTLDVRLVERELVATGRVYTPQPAGYKCIQKVPIYIRMHEAGATEWSSTGDPHATTDQYGRYRIELPLDSSWAQYRAVLGRQKYQAVHKACARAVSPTVTWPRNPIALHDPAPGATLGPETTFSVGVGNPAGVESVSFRIFPEGTRDACPRRSSDDRDYESPYEWTWQPSSASHDVVLGVAAWGRDGFAVCDQWSFRVGELGSLMWWGIDPIEDRSNLGASSTWFRTIEGRIPVSGFFDRDAMADIFWYSPSGEEEIWWGDGASFEKVASQFTLGPGLHPTVGDFDNDGHDDIIWYAPGDSPETGTDSIWWGAPGRTWEVSHVPQITGVWDQLVAGDYNGDGYDDIFFYLNNANGAACGNTKNQVYWWGKTSRAALKADPSSSLEYECDYRWLAGDFDGDTWDDFLAYGQSPNSRDYFIWRNPKVSAKGSQPYGFDPFVGDFNGDGRDDVFWFSPGDNDEQWWAPTRPLGEWFSPDQTTTQINGDLNPVSADFDGDGDDDILWYER